MDISSMFSTVGDYETQARLGRLAALIPSTATTTPVPTTPWGGLAIALADNVTGAVKGLGGLVDTQQQRRDKAMAMAMDMYQKGIHPFTIRKVVGQMYPEWEEPMQTISPAHTETSTVAMQKMVPIAGPGQGDGPVTPPTSFKPLGPTRSGKPLAPMPVKAEGGLSNVGYAPAGTIHAPKTTQVPAKQMAMLDYMQIRNPQGETKAYTEDADIYRTGPDGKMTLLGSIRLPMSEKERAALEYQMKQLGIEMKYKWSSLNAENARSFANLAESQNYHAASIANENRRTTLAEHTQQMTEQERERARNSWKMTGEPKVEIRNGKRYYWYAQQNGLGDDRIIHTNIEAPETKGNNLFVPSNRTKTKKSKLDQVKPGSKNGG